MPLLPLAHQHLLMLSMAMGFTVLLSCIGLFASSYIIRWVNVSESIFNDSLLYYVNLFSRINIPCVI